MPIIYQHIQNRWVATRAVQTTVAVGRSLETVFNEGETIVVSPSRGVEVLTQLDRRLILRRPVSSVIGVGRSLGYDVDAAQVVSITPSRGVALATAVSRTLIVNQAPVASLSVGNDPSTLQVTADASGSSDPDGDSLTYDYDWGDGTSSNDAGPSANHTYSDPQAAPFTVTLTVTDEHGASDTDTETVHFLYPEVVLAVIAVADNSVGVSVSLDNEGDFGSSDLVHIDFYIDGVFDGDKEGQFIGNPAPHLTTYTYSGLQPGKTYTLSCELFTPNSLKGSDFTTGTTSGSGTGPGDLTASWYPESNGNEDEVRLVDNSHGGAPPYSYQWVVHNAVGGTFAGFVNGTNQFSENPELAFNGDPTEATIELAVTDAASAVDTLERTIDLTPYT